MFCKSFHVRLLEIETSPKKIRGVEKESFTFEQNVTNELAFDFKTFCVCKKLVLFFNAKVWLIFGSLLLIIIFFTCIWVWNTWNNSNNKIKHVFFNNFSNVITKCDNICNMKYNSKLNPKRNWKQNNWKIQNLNWFVFAVVRIDGPREGRIGPFSNF